MLGKKWITYSKGSLSRVNEEEAARDRKALRDSWLQGAAPSLSLKGQGQ